MTKYWRENKILKIASFSLATVFGLVVFHAPISVYFGQYAPPLLVKSWKEIILLLLVPVVLFAVWRSGKLGYFSRDLVLRLILAYALLHIVLLFVFTTNPDQILAGLAIDLRYVLFFGLVFCVVSLLPSAKSIFLKVGVGAAGLSLSFATLQALILPPDILKFLGYSKDTIAPYLTVDKNSDFIRINGTLRGPNPLGAYVMMVISFMMVCVAYNRAIVVKYKAFFSVISVSLLVVLWASHSRSAWLGGLASVGIIFFMVFGRRLRVKHWLLIGGVLVLTIGTILITRDSYFTQNVILHNNPTESQNFNSNEGHTVSLQDGVARFIRQPVGAGIGSTGSASLLGDKPLIIENQYLFVAHETGWLGLGLYMAILFIVLKKLYKNRRDRLSLGVLASGVALAAIGLIQPVFVDDTISLVWWGLAAVALVVPFIEKAKHV